MSFHKECNTQLLRENIDNLQDIEIQSLIHEKFLFKYFKVELKWLMHMYCLQPNTIGFNLVYSSIDNLDLEMDVKMNIDKVVSNWFLWPVKCNSLYDITHSHPRYQP